MVNPGILVHRCLNLTLSFVKSRLFIVEDKAQMKAVDGKIKTSNYH